VTDEIVEGAHVHGAEAEPRDCKPHTAPCANPMQPVPSEPRDASPSSSLTFPHVRLTKQSVMNGCYQPEAVIRLDITNDSSWPES